MASNRINVNLAFNAETGKAKKQIQDLQVLLNKIAYSGTTASPGQKLSADLQKASEAAKQLQIHLNNAFNTKTGNFDLSLFNKSLKDSKTSVSSLSAELLKAGQTGQQAFLGLAQSISLADQPMLKISNRLKDFGVSLKNAVKWQLSSSIIHGFMGGIQSAYGYAQDLNESLNNIRIVTGYNVDKMAEFADYANKAAKALSTTTTEYTDASLIYFQQGLKDADVKKRTDTTIKLANVTGQSVEETANQMTAIWNNFDDGSKSLEYYADVITALGAATASSSKEISEGLNKFSAVAESVGLSYEYASAALATVTATTRQSADVVGNAFKTLFARIQGLKLGETLDDGTTLNKYSQALFNVGINIKDQSGQLKDMNTILDEMGSKWNTLSKDQQLALAQTVAGVRQYTQLVALMDQWDYFKQNLGVATESEGTLTKQAKIYEESWEAASKRVKASMESIYQNLIDDKFFISINNGLANLLTGIGAFVKEMGGAKTLLTGFASIFLSNFAIKIPQAIQSVVYNLQLLSTEGTKKVYTSIEADMQKATQQSYQMFDASKGEVGIDKNSSMALAISQANDLTAARSKLTIASNKLSASEKQMYDSQLSIIQQAQQEAVAIKQKNEQLEREIQLQKEKISNANVGQTVVSGASLEALRDSAGAIMKLENQNNYKDILNEINSFSNQFISIKKKLEQQYNQLNKTLSQGFYSGTLKPLDISKIFSPNLQKEINNAIGSIENLVQKYRTIGDGGGKVEVFNSIKDSIRLLNESIPESIQKATGLKDIFDKLLAPGAINPDTLTQGLNQINEKLQNGTISAKDQVTILKELNGINFEQLQAKIDALKQGQNDLAEKTSMVKKLLNEFSPQHTVKTSEALGSLAGMAGSAVMSVNSLVSAFKSLGNEDLSPWQRFSGFIMGISMAVPAAMSAIRGFATVTEFANSKMSASLVIQNLSELSRARLIKKIGEENLQLGIKIAVQSRETGLTKEAAIAKVAEALAEKGVTNETIKNAAAKVIVNNAYATEKKNIFSLIALKTAELIQEKLVNKERETSIVLQTILNALTGKWGGLIAAGAIALGVGLIALAKWALGLADAEKQQKKAYETMKKSQEAYDEQSDVVNNLKSELESLGKTIDDLQKKGPLSLVEKQQLENAQKQKAQLEQELALEQAILKTKQEQAIYDWQKNGANNANWVKTVESTYYRPFDSELQLGRLGSTTAGKMNTDILKEKIYTEDQFKEWFFGTFEKKAREEYINEEDYEGLDYIEKNALINSAEQNFQETMKEQYDIFYKDFQEKNSERKELIQKYVESYNADLQGYQLWYKNLTDKEKQDAKTQTEMASYQARLKSQAIEIYGGEENYYKSFDSSFESSQNYGKVGKYILNNLKPNMESEDLDSFGNEIAKQFDDTFKELLNSMGISVDDYADYLAKKYKQLDTILDKTKENKNVTLNDLTSDKRWKSEYLDLLDDITVTEEDSIESIINKLKQKAEEIAGITQEQADLEKWTSDYANQMKVLSKLKQGDKISDEDYGTLGEAYQEYFQKQLDGTYMLTKAAEELQKKAREGYQENLKNQINALKDQRDKIILSEDYTKQEKLKEELYLRVGQEELSPEQYSEDLNLIQEEQKKIIQNITGITFDSYEDAKNYLNQLGQSLDETQLSAALTAQSIKELKELLNSGDIDPEEYNAALQSVVFTEAQLAGVDYSSVIAYAEQLANLNEGVASSYYEIALAELKSQQAMKNLADSSKDYIETLGTIETKDGVVSKLNADQAIAVDALATSFANLLGVEKDVFSADFIVSDPIVTALKAVQDGAKGAYEQLSLLLMMQANSENTYVKAFGNSLINANSMVKVGEEATDLIKLSLDQSYHNLAKDNKELADQILQAAGWVYDEVERTFTRISASAGLEDWQIALKDSAEAVGLNYTEVQKYAEILKELNDGMSDQEVEEMALAWMKQTTAIDKLNSGAKKYAETLAIVQEKGTDAAKIDWLNTYQELQQYFTMLTGTDLDKANDIFNKDFIQSDEVQQALQDMANGVEGAYGRLFGIVKAQALGLEDEVLNNIIEISSMDLEVGVEFEIDNDSTIKSLYDALKELDLDSNQIKEFFRNSFNLELEIDGDKLVSATKTGTEAKKTIEDLAKEANIAYEDVQEYAKILVQTNRATEETAEAMALSLLKQSKGFDELSSKAKEYVDNLKGVTEKEITSDQSKYINDLADSLALLIGVEKEAFGDNLAGFIASDAVMTAIEEFNNGVDGSIEKLILLASLQASGFSVNKDGEVENSTKLTNFSQQAIKASQTMGVGDTNSDLFNALNILGGKEYEAALQSLRDLGFEIKDENTIIRTSLIPTLAAGKSAVEKLSESFGVSYDAVKKNAETLRTLYPELKDNIELSERMALAELAQSEAVKDLTSNYQNYIDTLNTATYGSAEYIQAYQALADDLSKITGITDKDFLKSLIIDNKEIQQLLSKVASGEKGAADDLRMAVAIEFVTNNNEGNIQEELLKLLRKVNIDIPVGFTLKEGAEEEAERNLYEIFRTLYNEYEELVGSEEAKSLFEILGISVSKTEGEEPEFTRIASDILETTKSIKDQAEAFSISYEEVQDYAKILRENNEALKDQIELSEKIALAEKKQAKGADDLIDKYKDYANILKKAQLDKRIKNTEEYAKAIASLKKDLSLLTGYEEGIFTTDFINSDEVQQALLDVSNGVEGATERLKALSAVQYIKLNVDKANITTDLDQLALDIAELNNQDIQIGAYIDDAPALDALADLLNSTSMTVDQMQEFFNNLGWEPEIDYVQVDATTAAQMRSKGYQQYAKLDPDGNGYTIEQVPLEGDQELNNGQNIWVPKIKSKAKGGSYKKIDIPGNSSTKKPSTGGGGGGSKKHAEKKSDSEKTRYHTLQNQLEDLKAEYDSISKAADRAFGKDKLKAIDNEINKTQELIDKQKEYVDAIKANLPADKAIMDAYYTDLIGGTIEYDERGNIANYDQIQDAMFAKYNEMAAKYGEDSKEWQVFKEKYEQLQRYIEQYEETYDLLRDEEEAYQDLLRQRFDLKLAKIQYSVEIQLEIPDSEIAVLEYKLGRIEDDAFKSAEAIGLLTREAEAVYKQIQTNKQGLNDLLQLSLSTQEILQLMNGDTSVLEGKTFTAEQIEAIKQYRDNLLDLNKQLDSIRSNIEDKVMEVFDAWNEKLDSGINKLDHYKNVLDSYKNIIDIVGRDALGLSDTFMATLSQSSIDNAINKVTATKKAYETMLEAQNRAEQELEEAKKRNDEASIKMWEENLKSITEEAESAREEMLSAWEEALSGIAEQFEATVERVVDNFNKEVYTLGGLEGLAEDFSRQQENADIMLDDYQKIYELSKLNRDINKSINDIDSLSGKQKLKKLLEQINALQEDGLEMSQYDLEYLQKTYDLRMAEIELEEARNAKNTVRLRKDNEGNWSYVYTQNMDAVDTAQQKYEDALYAMQDVSSNYIDEMSEKLISTSQEMEEALAAIRIQDFANIDDYYTEVKRVQKQYENELAIQQIELQKAINNNKILYDKDWTNYHNATGYKISDTQNFATSFRNTLLGSLTGSEEDTVNFTNIISSAVDTLTKGLMQGAEAYYTNLQEAMKAAGTSTDDFAKDFAEKIKKVEDDSVKSTDRIKDLATNMSSSLKKITDSVSAWQKTYGEIMQKVVDSNLDVINTFNQMLEVLSKIDSITSIYDTPTSNNGSNQSAPGDYDGDLRNWIGIPEREKDFIIDDDTPQGDKDDNLDKIDLIDAPLRALGIVQTILDTIDLNAAQASYGFGNLVPATINENNSQTIEQDVHITAEFPNVTDKNEIEQAFETLINKASQYANRK